ncbi:MAG TPA: hypothetical protein VMV56_05870 [Williamwhitmania sp.]|nr:hypothetical protein [Williamwhitmania sp.]
MKTHRFIFFISILLLFVNCASFKGRALIQTGGKNEAIQNAILDFSNSSKLYKADSVFSVLFLDTVRRMVLSKLDDGSYKWIIGRAYKGIIAVSISASHNRFLYTADTKVGSKGKLPSRYVEKSGKLFFWWDDNYALTEEVLDVFRRYELLQDDEGGTIKFLDSRINDAQKATDYYFCKKDLTNYKKVTTNKAIGYYEPPKLSCKP